MPSGGGQRHRAHHQRQRHVDVARLYLRKTTRTVTGETEADCGAGTQPRSEAVRQADESLVTQSNGTSNKLRRVKLKRECLMPKEKQNGRCVKLASSENDTVDRATKGTI